MELKKLSNKKSRKIENRKDTNNEAQMYKDSTTGEIINAVNRTHK